MLAISFVSAANAMDPELSSTEPSDNATSVALDANIVLTFSENMRIASGNFVIKKASDDSTVQTINGVSDSAAFSGGETNAITINPPSDLASGTEYYITISSQLFMNFGSDFFAGIADKTTLSFTGDIVWR